MGNLWEPSQPNRFRRNEYRDICRSLLSCKSSTPSSELYVDVGQVRGVKSELTSKVTEDDIERELMLSPSVSLLLSPNRDQERPVGTSGEYRD
jgi:hypothetical protein